MLLSLPISVMSLDAPLQLTITCCRLPWPSGCCITRLAELSHLPCLGGLGWPSDPGLTWHLGRATTRPGLFRTILAHACCASCHSICLLSKVSSFSVDWCGSVDWVAFCKPKGCQFDSQSGYLPGLQARSPVGGVQEATNRLFSPSLSPTLPLTLKIKSFLKKYPDLRL